MALGGSYTVYLRYGASRLVWHSAHSHLDFGRRFSSGWLSRLPMLSATH